MPDTEIISFINVSMSAGCLFMADPKCRIGVFFHDELIRWCLYMKVVDKEGLMMSAVFFRILMVNHSQ